MSGRNRRRKIQSRTPQTETVPIGQHRWLRKTFGAVLTVAILANLPPLFVGFSIQPPGPAYEGQPFSVPFEITNHNPIPAAVYHYDCILSGAKFDNGLTIERLTATPALQQHRTLFWKDVMTARCEHIPQLEALHLLKGHLQIDVLYRMPGLIPHRFTWTFDAIVESRTHEFLGWVPQ